MVPKGYGCLKFAVISTSPTIFPTWQANCLTQLLDYEHAELALIIVPEYKQKRMSKWRYLLKNSRFLFWMLFYKYLVLPKLKAMVPRDMSSTLQNTEIKKIKFRSFNRRTQTIYCDDEDLKNLKIRDLDFILHFEDSILKGEILNAAKYGVWRFHYGAPEYDGELPPAFWETFNKSDSITVTLQRLTEDLDRGYILHKGELFCSQFSCKGTYRTNLDRVLLSTTYFPKRACQELIHSNTDIIRNYPFQEKKVAIKTKPNNCDMLKYFFHLSSRIYSWLVTHPKITMMSWRIGVIERPIESFVQTTSINEHSIKYINSDLKKYFMADPFGVSPYEEGTGLILFEKFDQIQEEGKISYLKWDNGREFQGEDNILETPGHLSYPYLICENGALYCIPESSASNEVSLWKRANTGKWYKKTILIHDFPAVDITIMYSKDYWWLFCTHKEMGDNSHLFIWYSKTLTGSWQQHALNPVKCDIRSSRPAGTPFIIDDIIYRPSQNCAGRYGKSIMVNRIKSLSPTSFQEEFCCEIQPPLGKQGMHTISKFGSNAVLIDVYSKPIFSFRKLKKLWI
ncbi:hypothetical protein OQJ05_15125 [Fluoribacter gormanii]|uniref:glucosamine inositolphosphorylceramide transferase family protein n=1 Tax=Fluoribacter gormanii TaxID=464 RepID=UPI0022430B28|nr:hypothetical protein [Fluoribacter gormanii]MCW8445377.1 hypothetical protein [Fluoribacter gormanii]